MAYNLRERIPRDYAAMHTGQAEDEEEVFHDSFQYQLPPGTVVSSSPGRDLASTPFSGQQNLTHSSSDDVAVLIAAIEHMGTENEALERQTEVSRLQAELHALQRRNAELQKHTLLPQRKKPPSTQSKLNIKALRSDPTLSVREADELERLGFSSSDSEDDDEQPSRIRGKRLRLKPGKTTKLTRRVVKPQLWPHSQLRLAYVSKTKTYEKLTIAEFSPGYATILKLPSLSETERSTRLDHFIVLMYLVSQFNWSAVREFHAAVLFKTECDRARWGDSFADLETHLLCNSSRSTSSGAAGRSGSGTPVLFCRDYQNNKCSHGKHHFGTIRKETKWLQHICAKCWTVSRVIGRHSEFSPECPTKSVVSGSATDHTSLTSHSCSLMFVSFHSATARL